MFSSWLGLLAFFGIFCAASFLVFVLLQGRRSRGGNQEENALHRIWVKLFAGTLLLGVVGVEGMIRLHGGLWDTTWLAWLHGAFVIVGTTFLLLLLFRLTGLKHPKVHGPLAYAFATVFCGMLVTGGILFARYPG